jgi:hypothetical protein
MRVKSNSLLAVLVGLTLNIGFSSAATAAPATLTITGFIGNSVTPEDVPLQHNLSAWFGKAYTLEMTYDADGIVGTQTSPNPDFPGLILNKWSPVSTSHSFVIDGALVSASATGHASVETFNDFTMPPSTFPGAPPGIVGGNIYDSYLVSADGVGFGCVDGACDSAEDTYENFRMTPQYFWDVSQLDAITDSSLPNVLGGAPYFTGGFGFMPINFEQWNEATGAMDAGFLDASVTSMTVTAVPEAETYAMMLAGLGLVGFMARRRKQIAA